MTLLAELTAIITILGALLIGAMSPGPSFVIVARNSIGLSRRDGLATALGMGFGGVFFSGVALAGLYTLLAAVGWLYMSLKVVGGVYLIYLAWKIWRGARTPLLLDNVHSGQKQNLLKSFLIGLSTQLSNPKTSIFYGSIFAAMLPQHTPMWFYMALLPLTFIVEAGWYSVVALCFSSRRPRELYLESKVWIDRIAAGAMVALGIRLIFASHKTGF